MRPTVFLLVAVTVSYTCLAANGDRKLSPERTFREMCDASAAVALTPDSFVVASDEDNELRIFRSDTEKPVFSLPLSSFLETEAEHPEADIEGATWLGDRIFWITSHGRNSEGHHRPNRLRLFATKAQLTATGLRLEPVGKPCKHLLRDLKDDDRLEKFKLKDAAKLAPEAAGGLNIEGLSATRDGDLLIGFRNPIPDGKALLVPLKNPNKVLDGDDAKFGKPILLNLGGKGVRSLEYWPARDMYLIVAGPFDGGDSFALYQWSGDPDHAPEIVTGPAFDTMHPEALFLGTGPAPLIHLLSDDGDHKIGSPAMDCKTLGKDQQRFRAVDLKW